MLDNLHKMIKQAGKILAGSILIASATSCVHLKEYQKTRLNDSEMALTNRKVEKNELNFQMPGKQAADAGAINFCSQNSAINL